MTIPHIPPKKVLAAYDFSPNSRAAWGFGRSLARSLGASIETLYVYEEPIYAESLAPLPITPIIMNPLTEDLKRKFVEDIHRDLGESAPATVLQGHPTDCILETTSEHAIDLIVMGTHGRTGVSRVLFGSVAEWLSRHSPVPVLTVRDGWRPVQTMLVPINFMNYSLDGLYAAAALAELLGGRFDALYVAEQPYSEPMLMTEFEDAVKNLSPYFADKAPRLLRGVGNPAERIALVGADYDLVVLVAHRKSMLHDIVLGTTAERVLRHSPTPVLALPSSKEAPTLLIKKGAVPAHSSR